MEKFAGKKTFVVMGVSLVVALFQHFAFEIPPVDPELFAIGVPLIGIVLRFATHKKVSIMDMLRAVGAAKKGLDVYNETVKKSKEL